MLIGLLAWLIIMPQVDWGAVLDAGAIEKILAPRIIVRWVAHGPPGAANPIPPTAANSEAGRDE
jgi:hypothetical protein